MAKSIRSLASAVTGAVTAAGVVYYFDATSGRRRRALLGERSASVMRRVVSRVRVAGRDLGNRIGGLSARAVAAFRPGSPDPTVLAERVRACLGRVVSHPGAVHVTVTGPQQVLLRGAVLAWEHQPLLRAVEAVAGVREVKDEMAVYESAEHISALQGGVPRRERRPELLQERWSSGTRLLMALAGGSLLVGGTRRRGAWGTVSAAAGGALLLRSVINAPLRDIARGQGPHLELRKSLGLAVPPAQAYRAMYDCERFPSFMQHVAEVQRCADGSTHWVMKGPWNLSIEWNAVTTQVEPDRLLAWRTTPGSSIEHWGLMRFEADEAGGTRLHIYLSYRAPAGRLGQAVARLFGADAESGLNEDLMRLKAHLEQADSAAVRRNESGIGSTGPGAADRPPTAASIFSANDASGATSGG